MSEEKEQLLRSTEKSGEKQNVSDHLGFERIICSFIVAMFLGGHIAIAFADNDEPKQYESKCYRFYNENNMKNETLCDENINNKFDTKSDVFYSRPNTLFELMSNLKSALNNLALLSRYFYEQENIEAFLNAEVGSLYIKSENQKIIFAGPDFGYLVCSEKCATLTSVGTTYAGGLKLENGKGYRAEVSLGFRYGVIKFNKLTEYFGVSWTLLPPPIHPDPLPTDKYGNMRISYFTNDSGIEKTVNAIFNKDGSLSTISIKVEIR